MDNPQKSPTILSLCTGYGGLEIGIKRAIGSLDILAHVEIEAYAAANLVAKMEAGELGPAPIWTDLKTLPVEPFRDCVDILTGGYPCQPFSAAGKRKGADDPRHLWPHIRRLIRAIRPGLCFFENVEGHVSLGLSTVISDLEEDGYRTTWGIFSAAELGYWFQRKRVFILARSTDVGLLWMPRTDGAEGRAIQVIQKKEPPLVWVEAERRFRNESAGGFSSKPLLDRRVHGPPAWVDRLQLLGNGVVPQTAEKAFKILMGKITNGR